MWISYEGLPPNFSLLQNMAAGAFAGIAVSCPTQGTGLQEDIQADTFKGAYRDVPD